MAVEVAKAMMIQTAMAMAMAIAMIAMVGYDNGGGGGGGGSGDGAVRWRDGASNHLAIPNAHASWSAVRRLSGQFALRVTQAVMPGCSVAGSAGGHSAHSRHPKSWAAWGQATTCRSVQE